MAKDQTMTQPITVEDGMHLYGVPETVGDLLKHAMMYCDERAGAAMHDPEGVPNEQESQDYQEAAQLLNNLWDGNYDQPY